MILTVSSVTKENQELALKARILQQDSRNYKDQLRITNEK